MSVYFGNRNYRISRPVMKGMTHTPGNEEQLLLRLAGLRPSAGAAEALPVVTMPDRFLWLAGEHGVSAFVYNNLQALNMTGILPPAGLRSLMDMAYRSMIRNSFITGATLKTAALLNKEGIIPVLIKGVALEETVYRRSGLRPMTDADILLPGDKCLRAWELLQREGFTASPLKSPLHRPLIMFTGKHLPTLLKGGFPLEIHHSLFGPDMGRLTAAMVNNATETTIAGTGPALNGRLSYDTGLLPPAGSGDNPSFDNSRAVVAIPPPDLHFLYLVWHLARHEEEGHSQLRLYNDLAAMISFYGAEETAGRALRHAASTPLEAMVCDRLALLHRYLGTALPDKYCFMPARGTEDRFLAFLAKPKDNKPVKKRTLYRARIKAVPGLHRKCLWLMGDIFPSTGYMKKRYRKKTTLAVLPLYIIRPGKLFRLIVR